MNENFKKYKWEFIVGAVILLVLLIIPLFLQRYGLYTLAHVAVVAIAAIGLNLTLGYAGQISLAQGAFMGIGSYCSAILVSNGYSYGLALVLAIMICFAVGWLLGYPAIRVQHHYLAFVTLAFAILVFLVLRNESWLTKGTYGITGFKRPEIFGWSTRKPIDFYYFSLICLGLVMAFVWWLLRSPWGRAFKALRENPIRAQSLGMNNRIYILSAFAIGSAIGGVAGVLHAPLIEYVDPNPYALSLSLSLLLMVIVGGPGYFLSPIIGAFIAVFLPELLRFTHGYYLMIYALLVLLILVFYPKGIMGFIDTLFQRIRAKNG